MKLLREAAMWLAVPVVIVALLVMSAVAAIVAFWNREEG